MPVQLYNPFERFEFSGRKCFLSGVPTNGEDEYMTVFPQWMMEQFDLFDKSFKYLNEEYTTYGKLRIPCASDIMLNHMIPFQKKISETFNHGYEAVKELSEQEIFLWAGTIVYGLVYREIINGLTERNPDEPFYLAQALQHKFRNHHNFLQSLYQPLSFEQFKPWSFFLFKVEGTEEPFEQRNEMNTLTFSFRMKDFGFVICMQDNGENSEYHSELYEQFRNHTLTHIQFLEFCAKVYYSSYLFNRLPEYDYYQLPDELNIEAKSLYHLNAKPVFDEWQPKVYAQLLEAFWKPWNYSLVEILKNPAEPMSFLKKES
jgi:hypothetical protein